MLLQRHIRDTAWGSGTLALVKDGAGTLTLTGSYGGQYTGGLIVENGTLDYSGGALPNCNYTIAGGTLNTGSLTKSIKTFQITGGTVTGDRHAHEQRRLRHPGRHGRRHTRRHRHRPDQDRRGDGDPHAQQYLPGTTTINGGTLQLGNGGSSGSLSSYTSIVVNSGGTFAVNRGSGTMTFSSKISGVGTLEEDGAGVLAISGSNTFSGNLVVNNGTLNYGGNSTLPAGNYTVNGGTLNSGALSKTMGTLKMTGGTATGTGTLTPAAYDLQNGTVSVLLGGSGALSKTTPGTASLTKSLPSGNYAISDGTLNLNGLSQTIGTLQTTGGTVTGTGTLDARRLRSCRAARSALPLAAARR